MNIKQRRALIAAKEIHQALAARVAAERYGCLPEAAWSECRRRVRLIQKAKQRNWKHAQQHLEREFPSSIAKTIDELARLRQHVESWRYVPTIAEPREIFADLLALDAEFVDIEIDVEKTAIAVETERIELQGFDLGPFRIVLDWSQLSRLRPYQVIAREPNPAARSSDITHPHVQDGHLCEGDGHAAIRNALQHGRLLDFFILIRQILETYNPGNAYVKLENWNGRDCSDCGRLVRDEDCIRCERCDAEICSGCATCCTNCSECFCSSHVSDCRGCNEPFCNRCLAACQSCGGKFCKECLDEKKCPTCRQRDEEIDEATDEPDDFENAGTADAHDSDASVHAVRVGQAAVPA